MGHFFNLISKKIIHLTDLLKNDSIQTLQLKRLDYLLYKKVTSVIKVMTSLGVKTGDRVTLYCLSNKTVLCCLISCPRFLREDAKKKYEIVINIGFGVKEECTYCFPRLSIFLLGSKWF